MDLRFIWPSGSFAQCFFEKGDLQYFVYKEMNLGYVKRDATDEVL